MQTFWPTMNFLARPIYYIKPILLYQTYKYVYICPNLYKVYYSVIIVAISIQLTYQIS